MRFKFLQIALSLMTFLLCILAVKAGESFSVGQDVSHLIKNPNFEKQDGWNVLINNGETQNDKVRFDATNRLLEKWWGNMKVEQTIEDIPNGVYRLQIQGFQWHCWDWTQGAQWWKEGTDNVTGEIALNNDALKTQNVYSVGKTDITEGYYASSLGYYVPNDAATARKFFNLGLYENTVETRVTNNKLTITLSMIELSFWCCYTNARLTYIGDGGETVVSEDPTGECNLTAAETAREMGIGWNLGNTFEAGGGESQNFTNKAGLSAETYWQGTKTTQGVIDFVKAQGFNSIRIPCAWVMGHISDASTYKIDERWMARVKEVVNMCIKAGLYVVLNDHWDGGWLESSESMKATGAAKEKNKEMLQAIWTQIAEEFKDYDYHLIFAGLNEPNAKEDNNASLTKTMMANLTEYEQVFIDAVRATGGSNANRVLVVQAPCTSHELACGNDYKMPKDPTATDRLMLEVHYYNPWQFWGMEKDESWGNCFYYWGKENHVAGSKHNPTWDCEEDNMRYWLEKLHTKYVTKGIPILFGEFGANWRNLSGMAGESQEKHDASIYLYYHLLCKYSLELGMVPMAWDTNYPNYGMTIIDRKKLEVYNTIMMSAIKDAIDVSDIEEVISEPSNNIAQIYDLQGRVVNPKQMKQGMIYVSGGKKILVK